RLVISVSARCPVQRPLPSVPTRRSSDLFATNWPSTRPTRTPASGPSQTRSEMWSAAEAPVIASTSVAFSRSNDTTFDRENATDRSEEHTSELQSLTNIVCRLLLETKNTD